ncbi:MAG: type II CAAX endopeptidase family protein [Wenzhouxiangella sp.]|jgi:membrane protease YdiL (CAAX protease family)|nr:type II CAAX endopeptidase family protein [Wenzhouxiangella sp.]
MSQKIASKKATLIQQLGRLTRALAAAATEVLSAIAFIVLLSILLFYTSDRLAEQISFGGPIVRITLDFWEPAPDRRSEVESKIIPQLSPGTAYRIEEPPESLMFDGGQTIVVHLEYDSLHVLFNYYDLPSILWENVVQARGGVAQEIVGFNSPHPLVFAFWVQFILIPWLFIRFLMLPPQAPPAKPCLAVPERTKHLLAKCLTSGIGLGATATLVFSVASAWGLLSFSDRMLSPETFEIFGMDLDSIWQIAVLVALAGAVEEVFFRGILLRRFVQYGAPVFGVFVCAFWFTLIHLSYFSWDSGNIIYIVWVGLLGIGLGFLTLNTRSWFPAAIFHGSYNFGVVLLPELLSWIL